MRLVFFFLILLTSSLHVKADPYSLFEQNGKVGLKNELGKIIIPPMYESLGWSDGNFLVTNQVIGYKLNGNWGVLNLSNVRVTPPAYTTLLPADGNLIIATKQSAVFKIQTGCINAEGKTIIPFMYTGVRVHSLRVVAFVREGNLFKHGLIDLNNKVMIPFEYKNIYPIGSLRFAVEDFNGKTALFSDGGRQITGFDIDSLSDFRNNLAILYEAGKQGLINREGQLKSEAKYREIKFTSTDVRVRMPDQWQILSADNNLLDTIEADSISWIEEGICKIQIAGRSWLADGEFKRLTNETFQSIGTFENGKAIFKKGLSEGVLRKNGSVLLPANFSKIIIGNNYFLTWEKNADTPFWTLRDSLGQRKTTKLYDQISKRAGDVFPVKKNGFWGVVDEYGNEIIACVYDSIFKSRGNQIAVKFKGKYGIISMKEEWLAYPQQYPVSLINNDRYVRKSDGTLFICSFNGTVLYFTNNPVRIYEDHFVESLSNGGSWTLDFDGRILSRQLVPETPTEEIFPSSEGLRGIKRNGKYGFIDDQGRLRIANRYEAIQGFSEGLAAVKIRNKWGFINREEKFIIHPNYDEVTPFRKGYSLVKQNGAVGLITTQGKLILPIRYQDIHVEENGRFHIIADGMHGLADEIGNVILYTKYESIQDLNNGFVIVKQHGKLGLINVKGISTIPVMYDQLTFDQKKNRYLGLQRAEWFVFKE